MNKSFLTCFLLFGFLLSSCAYYQRYRLPEQRLPVLKNEPMNYYLVDPARPHSAVWFMSRTTIEDQQVSCYITRMPEMEGVEVTKVRSRMDALASKNDVLIFPTPQFLASMPDNGPITLEVKNMEKIEVYELNHSRTFTMPVILLLGLMLLIAGLG